MRIAISPDENPGDPGAEHNGIVERTVNIEVATALEAALKRSGQDAWFNPDITFEQRIAEANKDGSSLLIACAHNAAGSPAAEGALFLFCAEPAAHAHTFGHQQALATKTGEALVASGLFAHWATYDENVAECCDFAGDTLYIEFGYETNPTDAAHIKQPDYAVRAAELVAQAVASVMGFAYAPLVHPSAPDPEWKTNLQQLPAPVSGVLASAVDVINTVTGEKISELAQGSVLSVAFQTRVRDVEYYVTQFSVDHATGSAIAKAQVTFEQLGDNPAAGDGSGSATSSGGTGSPQTGSGTPAGGSSDPAAGQTPAQGPTTPATAPSDQPKTNFLQDLERTLVNFADHELIQLIELGMAELKKRAA